MDAQLQSMPYDWWGFNDNDDDDGDGNDEVDHYENDDGVDKDDEELVENSFDQ